MAKRREPKPRPGARYDSSHVKLNTGEGQRAEGSYYYRWTDRYGHRHAIYSRTLAELRQREEIIMIEKHDGIRTGAANKTLNDLYDLWKDIKRGLKETTFENYKYTYDMYIKPVFGRNKLRDIKRSDVRRFYIDLMERKKLSLSTLDNVHSVLHQILQIAVDDDILRKNPSDNMIRELRMVNGDDSVKREALTMEQQNLFLDYMLKTPRYTHWYPIFFIMLNTGMRLGEITGLRHNDIRMDKRTKKKYISINHTLVYFTHNHSEKKGSYFTINTPKTRAGIREIPVSESVERAFEMEKEYQKTARITCRAHIDGYTDFVFLNQNGNVHTGTTLNGALQRIIRDCNSEMIDRKGLNSDIVLLPHFSCHVLRHTFATRAAESGVLAPKTLQMLLGHTDITTTFNIYVSCNEQVKRLEITALEKYMETGKKEEGAVEGAHRILENEEETG